MEIPISNGINLLWGIINYQPSSYWGTLVYGNPHFEWDKSAVGHYQLSTFKLLGYPRLWKSPFEWDKSAVGHYQLSTFKLLGYPRLWKSPFRMG